MHKALSNYEFFNYAINSHFSESRNLIITKRYTRSVCIIFKLGYYGQAIVWRTFYFYKLLIRKRACRIL